jgi:branched-chain amino acid transport system permease protein
MDATGYNVAAYTVVVFAVSGMFSAIAGMLDTYLQGSVSPENFGWLLSAEIMIFAILGGARFFIGPMVGAAIVLGLEVYTSTFTDRWTTVLGVVYVLTALFLASGVLGLLSKLGKKKRGESEPDESPPQSLKDLDNLTQVQS